MKKYLFGILLASVLLAILLPVRVRAEGRNGIRLDERGTVTVVSPYAAQEEISSLGFCLSVESPGVAAAEFQFEGNAAEILEYRYDSETRKLNVYLSGKSALFADGTDALTIGRVIVRDGSGRETAAGVSVVKDSLQYVQAAELKTLEGVELPGTVQIGSVPGTAPAVTPAVTQPPEEPEDSQDDPQDGSETQPSAAVTARPPAQTPGTVSRPQTTKEPSRPQSPGGSSGNGSQTTGSESGSAENGTPVNTPENDGDGYVFSNTSEEEDTDQTSESKGFNVILVIAVIVIVIVVIVEIAAFIVVKKKPGNES